VRENTASVAAKNSNCHTHYHHLSITGTQKHASVTNSQLTKSNWGLQHEYNYYSK